MNVIELLLVIVVCVGSVMLLSLITFLIVLNMRLLESFGFLKSNDFKGIDFKNISLPNQEKININNVTGVSVLNDNVIEDILGEEYEDYDDDAMAVDEAYEALRSSYQEHGVISSDVPQSIELFDMPEYSPSLYDDESVEVITEEYEKLVELKHKR